MAANTVLVDVTRCIGCRGCQSACKDWNQLPAEQTRFTGNYENPPGFLPYTWTRVGFNEVAGNGEVKWYFSKLQCMHCTEPVCLKACPVEAVHKTRLETVDIDQKKCIGCGLCQIYCPFDVPKVDQKIKKAWKCRLCLDRISHNLTPACVKACPVEALQFGERNKMLALAEEKVALLKKDGYPQAQIYGQEEMGGTHFVYVLGDQPSVYKLPKPQELFNISASSHLWEVALKPLQALALAGVLFSLIPEKKEASVK